MTTVRVYRRFATSAEVGPPGAWKLGDTLVVPGRGPWFGDDGQPSFDAEIIRVDTDGIALARQVLAVAA